MRKELYKAICDKLGGLYRLADGSVCGIEKGGEVPKGAERVIRHIDLWNRNVDFIEQEESWARPAVFVEFCPIRWNALVNGMEYRAEPLVNLHVVTDWNGSASADSDLQEEALEVFDLPELIHGALTCLKGEHYMMFDLVESQTNHNHEEIVENIEVYQCVAQKRLK